MRFIPSAFIRLLCVITLSLTSLSAWSSVVITGTRVIYPAGQKEVTVKLSNAGTSPVLVQSWIDNGDLNAKPENISVPFILTPPINRIEPGKGQTLRLSYTGAPLPANKESVYWLNVLEVPAKAKGQSAENYLQMAFRSRIKLFYRPAGLAGNANDAAKELSWTAGNGGLIATNPTPYYVSLVTVAVNNKPVEGQMVAPGSSQTFKLPAAVSAGNKVQLTFVNDYGAVVSTEAVIK